MLRVDEVSNLLLNLLFAHPLGHEVDRHDSSIDLRHGSDLALDAILERSPLDQIGLGARRRRRAPAGVRGWMCGGGGG